MNIEAPMNTERGKKIISGGASPANVADACLYIRGYGLPTSCYDYYHSDRGSGWFP